MTPQELFESEEDLPRRIAWKWFSHYPIAVEDLASEGRVGLWEAALSYDPSHERPFGKFASDCIFRQLYADLKVWGRKLEQKERCVSWQDTNPRYELSGLTCEDTVGRDFTVEEVEARETWKEIKSDPILKLRAAGYSWDEVAKKTGLSRSWVSTKGAKKLKELRGEIV